MSETKTTADGAALLRETDAALLLSVPVPTLRGWRQRGGGPPFVKMGSLVRYRRGDLDEYVAANMRRTTSEQR